MLKPALLALLCLLACQTAFSQATISGSVTDTLNAARLPGASVVALRAKDSVIAGFTRTRTDGAFKLKLPGTGKFILRVTFPGFVDYVDVVNVDKNPTDVGDLPMVSRTHLMQEFVFRQQISAIKIKGDTTEYIADSFKVKDNATVEDLLKRLPGIQVDKTGQITAQGETVQKILVDGEEFFSDDPKVVTQGLQANAVEKVQVFDKKSDQAEFTGIDDGQKTKTINLELKEDKKKGYFGKIDAGGGTDGYFQDQAMINAFKAKSQFSAFGIMSNTDKVGLGWQDNDKFGGGNNTLITDDGGVITYFDNSGQDFGSGMGPYNGQGLPKTWTGGMHYADKWDEDKDHLTANYRYAMQDVELNGNTINQYVLPGSAGMVSNLQKTQFSKGERHGLDFSYERKIDSTSSIKLSVDGGYKQSDVSSVYNTSTANSEGAQLNTNNRDIQTNTYADYVNADLLYKKKFRKKGRSLSVDVKENYKESTAIGTLNSTTVIDTSTFITREIDSTVNQKKTGNTNSLKFSASSTYTEPLSKVAFMELNYSLTVNNSLGNNLSYNYDSSIHRFSNTIDSAYSSDFRYNILTNRGGLNFKFVYKTVTFSFGSDISNADYHQTDLLHGDTASRYNYFNLFPKANVTFNISKQTSIKLNYYGSTQQPSITQIQPLRQNSDPLNITVGNPSLKQQFNNNVSLTFNDYKVLTGRYLYGNLSFSTVADAISTQQTTVGGINTTQYINVNGNYTGYGYFGGGFKIKNPDMFVGLHANVNLGHTINYIATPDSISGLIVSHKNLNNNNSYGFGPYISHNKENKYDISIQPQITYNDNHATIGTFAASYWAFTCNVDGSVQLPKKFEISSSADFMIREKTVVFTSNNNVIKWNAFLGKKFGKKSQLELKANVMDILNQNIGYSRTAQAGYITQNTYNTIRRYGMLQLVWNFTHTPAGAPAPAGPTMIIKQ